MTRTLVRLYALAATMVAFLTAVALIAAHPWRGDAAATTSPQRGASTPPPQPSARIVSSQQPVTVTQSS